MKQGLSNEPVSAVIHLVGLVMATFGFVLLMKFTKEYGSVYHLVGFIIFGVSLILLLLVSSVYHFIGKGSRFKRKLKRLDHIMIYVFMASTYTPLCLTIDNRYCGWGLLIVVWGCAAIGIAFKAIDFELKEWVSVLLYLVFGMLILSIIDPVMQWLPHSGVGFLYGGGSLYLIGVIFYLLEEYGPKAGAAHFHAVWHLFVIAGSFSHAWLMFRYVLYV